MRPIKNYLVLKNYQLTDAFFVYTDMLEVKKRYARMQEMLVESAHKYLKDLDEVIIDTNIVPHEQYMFKDHMRILDMRHHREPCNILYCDLDVMFIRPVEIFGKYDHFCMLEHQCGIRYYPYQGITTHIWNIQRTEMRQWNERIGPDAGLTGSEYQWDREQDIYVKMMSQVEQDQPELLVLNENSSLFRFRQLIHCVYSEFDFNARPALVHYNGTGQSFDALELGEKMLKLAQSDQYEKIGNLLNCQPYRDWVHPPD